MTTAPHPLHDALVELAEEGAPASASTAVPPGATDPWRRAVQRRRRRRAAWVGVAVAAGVVVVVAAQAASYGIQGRHVMPVSVPAGPGSLPDRIYPTRSTILSVEQAPIGRAALVYDGPMLGSGWGRSTTVPIAVGADADVYRALPAASAWSLSPDGQTFAYLAEPAETLDLPARLHLLDLRTGHDRVVRLRDEGHGLEAAAFVTLLWSPDGGFVVTELDVRNHAVGSGDSSGQVWLELIDATSGAVTSRPFDAELIDWYDNTSILVQDPENTRTVDPATGQVGRNFDVVPAFVVGSYGEGQNTYLSPNRQWVAALHQAPGVEFHTVQIVSLPPQVGVQGPATRPVPDGPYETSNGKPVREDQQPLGWVSSDRLAVKAQVFVEPAQGLGGGVRLVVEAVQIPSLRTTPLMQADARAHVNTLQLAADVLAGGRVRHSSAPNQPLLDLRTLAPAVGLWLQDWWLLILVAGVAVASLLFVRRRGRRLAQPHAP